VVTNDPAGRTDGSKRLVVTYDWHALRRRRRQLARRDLAIRRTLANRSRASGGGCRRRQPLRSTWPDMSPSAAQTRSRKKPLRHGVGVGPPRGSVSPCRPGDESSAKLCARCSPNSVSSASPAIQPPLHLADPGRNGAVVLDCARRAESDDVALAVFPELCLTGYTCDDLFHQTSLLARAREALGELDRSTTELEVALVVGAPYQLADGRLFNCAFVIHRGRVRGAVPKIYLPNYGEYYEHRWFASGMNVDARVSDPLLGTVPVVGGATLSRRCHALRYRNLRRSVGPRAAEFGPGARRGERHREPFGQ